MSWKCSVPAQLRCGGVGKKAWLRLLQVWAKANCRPGLHFLPNYHWQYIRRALLKKIIIMRQPSTVEIKDKSSAASSTSYYSTIQCVSSLPITSNRWSQAGLEKECWAKWSAQAVLEDHRWCVEWFKQSLCYSFMVPVGRLLLHSL